MEYNKLIRDKIPDIIKSRGDSCKVHVAGEEEYWNKLKQKLSEEVDEFVEDSSIEELADIQEVVNAITNFKFGGVRELEEIRIKRLEKRGAFEKKLILDEADDR